MVMPLEPDSEAEAAFVMQENDRFHSIISSGDIHFSSDPGTVAVLTFFIIRRATGLFDIFSIHKTFEESGNVRRLVQSKQNISEEDIERESCDVRDVFGKALSAGSGIPINWQVLDLSQTTDKDEQIRKIKEWNSGVKVKGL